MLPQTPLQGLTDLAPRLTSLRLSDPQILTDYQSVLSGLTGEPKKRTNCRELVLGVPVTYLFLNRCMFALKAAWHLAAIGAFL